jgi:hypothetical protein
VRLPDRPTAASLLLLGVLPVVAFAQGGRTAALGRESPDLLGHLWTIWHATQEPLTRTMLLSWPEGVDLLPILGGWADIALAAAVAPALGVMGGWNLAMAAYLGLAGLGGWALSRELGAGPLGAAAGGLVLQLDPATLHHLHTGRGEQVGIGVLALFLAAGLRAHRQAGWGAPVALALTGVASLAVAWEYGLFVALFGLLVFLGAPDNGARMRVLGGGLGAVLLSLPLVLPFVFRSMEAPPGRFVDDWAMRAARNALVPFGPRGWGGALPAVVPMLALLGLPWTATGVRPRVRALLGGLLLFCLLAALGPEPHLSAPPEGEPRAWAPFTWLHALPVFSRYQTPVRLLAPWGLLAAAAVGLAGAAAVRRWGRRGAVVAVVLVGAALFEVRGLLPRAEYRLPRWPGLERIAQDPHPGAVYDLPASSRGGRSIDKQLAQMVHGRPIRHHSLQVYLEGAEPPAVDPFQTFTLGRARQGEEQRRREALALQSLQDRGFGWVVLYAGQIRPSQEDRLANRVSSILGAPAVTARGLRAWRVPEGGERGE